MLTEVRPSQQILRQVGQTKMDIQVILDRENEEQQVFEDVTRKSLADTLKFFSEREKSESELLADLIYEDFIRCR
jgi:hypothetical protein